MLRNTSFVAAVWGGVENDPYHGVETDPYHGS